MQFVHVAFIKHNDRRVGTAQLMSYILQQNSNFRPVQSTCIIDQRRVICSIHPPVNVGTLAYTSAITTVQLLWNRGSKSLFTSVRFVGGELNTCYNCLDRHVERGFGSQPAIIHDSPVTNTIRKISYKELLCEASMLSCKVSVLVADELITKSSLVCNIFLWALSRTRKLSLLLTIVREKTMSKYS